MPTFQAWIAAVMAAKVSPQCLRTLTEYGLTMSQRGFIRTPRADIARMAHQSTRTIDRHLAEAVAAGLLEVHRRPTWDRPATYRAIVPGQAPR